MLVQLCGILLGLYLSQLANCFTPPPVYRHANALRTIDLSKGYIRETLTYVVENIASSPQSEYYLPLKTKIAPYISSLEARERKAKGGFFPITLSTIVDDTSYYRIAFDKPLASGDKLTLQVNYGLLSQLHPLPKQIVQDDIQYLTVSTDKYMPSAYDSVKQRTKVKLPSNNIPDFTKSQNSDGEDEPARSGTTLTYGPYTNSSSEGSSLDIRYEFTKPLTYITRLERDIEISHWGGNAAFEERYTLTNKAASLRQEFSRLKWSAAKYFSPPTSAIEKLVINLHPDIKAPYFTDEIGNVSTSRFRPGGLQGDAYVELRPRYPVFGGWNYTFNFGWNLALAHVLKRDGQRYILKVPFLEGPEDAVYETTVVSVILPEGARNVKVIPPLENVHQEGYYHRSFLDTIGRTVIRMTAKNVIDDLKQQTMIVSYEYPPWSPFRKVFVVSTAAAALFAASIIVGKLEFGIGDKKVIS